MGSTRLHSLDALRAAALLLGIVLHGLMPFLPGDLWLVNDRHDAGWGVAVIVPIHMFRMALFFLIAGWFGRLTLQRRGTPGYLRDRAKRVLLPLFAFWPFAVLALVPFIVLDAGRAGRALPSDVGGGFSPGQLWFLWVLFECILIVVAARWLLLRTAGGERMASAASTVAGVLLAPGGVLLAAAPYAAAMLLQASAGGIKEPTTLTPEPAGLVGYVGAFTLGWVLSAGRGSLDALASRARIGVHLSLAVLLTVTDFVVFADIVRASGAGGSGTKGSAGGWDFVAHCALFAVAAWCWVYGLTGAAVRWLERERPWVRYLADASYWLYLLHLPLLVAGAYLVAPLSWPVGVKIAVVWLPTLVVLLLSYDLLVRSTWIGRWLNGRRYPRLIMSRGHDA